MNITNHQEKQIKTTMGYHITPVKITKIKKKEITSVGENVDKREHLCIVGGYIN